MIFPQVCSICGKMNTKSLCNKCKIKLEKSFKFQEDNYSKKIDKNFVEHYYFFRYEDIIRSQILSFKFREKSYIYKTIVSFLENKQKSFEKLKKYDIILVIPISKKRKKERGYNQSALMAKGISQIISAKVLKNRIYKIKNTVPQSTLNKEQREKNVKGVYRVTNTKGLKDKKILIFDDIYTTGNTVNECARVLVEKGIKKDNIGVLTIAKD
jgi:competence protein ComFC